MISIIKRYKNKNRPHYPDSAARDYETYKNFLNDFNISYYGIDCGFYVNDYYNPPESNEHYLVYI